MHLHGYVKDDQTLNLGTVLLNGQPASIFQGPLKGLPVGSVVVIDLTQPDGSPLPIEAECRPFDLETMMHNSRAAATGGSRC